MNGVFILYLTYITLVFKIKLYSYTRIHVHEYTQTIDTCQHILKAFYMISLISKIRNLGKVNIFYLIISNLILIVLFA